MQSSRSSSKWVLCILLILAITVWSFRRIEEKDAEERDKRGNYGAIRSDLEEEKGYIVDLAAQPEGCDGRRMYIHPLPAEFNENVVKGCDAYESWTNFCEHAKNGGYGPKTHRRSRSWYRTDAFMLEVIYHTRANMYDCLTEVPDEADVFYIPYYAGLDGLRYLFGEEQERGAEHGTRVVRWLEENAAEIWRRRGGKDHFMVMGRVAWDFTRPHGRRGGWGTGILDLPPLENVTALVLESRPFPWQEQAVPYPTAFHPPSPASLTLWAERVRRAKRTFLFAFAGGGGTGVGPNVRHSIRRECNPDDADSSSASASASSSAVARCSFISCDGDRCDHDPGYLMRAMMKADFCLQPPGDTPTRRAAFDAIVAGCIPVFFERQAAYTQYTWHLPPDPSSYSVLIPKDDVVFGGVTIGDVLGNISRADVARMREHVIGLIPRVVYRKADASDVAFKDAFDVALEGVLRRAKTTVREIREQQYEGKQVFL